jgi:hypothetical protein
MYIPTGGDNRTMLPVHKSPSPRWCGGREKQAGKARRHDRASANKAKLDLPGLTATIRRCICPSIWPLAFIMTSRGDGGYHVDGPVLLRIFYKYMFREGRIGDFRYSAAALNHRTREMRKRRVPIDRWVNFIHIGASAMMHDGYIFSSDQRY